MKVLHIATTDYGGAGIGMINLHKSLLSKGIDSKILLAKKTTSLDTIFQMEPNFHLYKWSGNRIVRKIQSFARNRGFLKTEVELWNSRIETASKGCDVPICFTSPCTTYDITNHPLVQDADIIHLHWVGDFLDYKSFFAKTNKPIVWTLRDENPGLGGFHYRTDKNIYEKQYGIIEDTFLKIKEKALTDAGNLTLVALSDAMVDFCKKNSYLSQKRLYKIYNSIDDKDFSPTNMEVARRVLGIDDDVFTISFVSVVLNDHRKGLQNLMDALKLIDYRVRVLCVGKNNFFRSVPENVFCYGNVENSRLLSLIYSASDIFVNPTLKESFGKTIVEALMCGVPVATTAEGVAPEIINEECGCLLDNASPQSIASALEYVRNKQYNRKNIREMIRPIFLPEKIVNQHIGMYNDILSTNNYFE